MDPLDQAAREDAWLRGWNEKGAGSERRLPGLERCEHLSMVAGTPPPQLCRLWAALYVDSGQGCPREVGARAGRSLPRLRKEQILKLGILLMFSCGVGLPNARLRGIPQRCAGVGQTGHEAE